jgi:hypothetical protein
VRRDLGLSAAALLAVLAASGCATAPLQAPAAASIPKPEPFPRELALAPPSAPVPPPEFRPRGAPRPGPGVEGARYVGRVDLSDGGFSVVFYEVRGETVLFSAYSSYAGTGAREVKSYEMRDGRFYVKGEPGWCNAIVSSGDCGVLGTISEDEITFVRFADGKPSSNQNTYPSQSVSPVPRQR